LKPVQKLVTSCRPRKKTNLAKVLCKPKVCAETLQGINQLRRMTKMKPLNLVLIGAGSAMFTQGLVAEMIHSRRPWKLGLVDIDPQALQVAEKLSRRMVQAGEADVEIKASMDRKDLLPEADVVVTTIGVGGRRAWEADVFIPRKYGIFQPVGDTIMAGGISRALRMIPAMIEIARDMVDLCPQATFLNYSNPMSVICWAVRQQTGANMVGLCIGVHEVKNYLADWIGKPHEEVFCLAAGLNHFTWIYDLRWQGEEAWSLVRARLEKERPAGNPFSWYLFDTYGAYPSASDRHVVEFFPERFPQGKYYGKQLGVDAFSFEGTIAYGDQIYAQMASIASGETPFDTSALEGSLGEHSQLLEIIESIHYDQRKTFTANLPNAGAVPNLPADAVLELTCAATGRGLLPLAVHDFPDLLAAPLQRKVAAQQITMEAALQGSRSLFVEALLVDGCVNDPVVAGKLADELLAAHKAYLPQFF
jgi:alpha-galactosidase